MPTPQKLTELTVNWASFCDEPANKGSLVAFWKRAVQVEKRIEQRGDKYVVTSEDGKVLGEHDTLEAARAQLRAIESKKEGAMEEGKLMEWLRGVYEQLGAALGMSGDQMKMADKPEEAAKQFEGLIGKVREKIAKVEPPKPDDIKKNLSPEALALVEKAEKAAKDADDKATKALADAAAEREARETAEFTKTAETTYGSLPGEPIAKGKALRSIEKLDAEQAKTVREMLAAGNAAIAQLSKEQGRSGLPVSGSAQERAIKKAEALMAENKDLKIGDALSKVFEADPSLHKEYSKEAAARH